MLAAWDLRFLVESLRLLISLSETQREIHAWFHHMIFDVNKLISLNNILNKDMDSPQYCKIMCHYDA